MGISVAWTQFLFYDQTVYMMSNGVQLLDIMANLYTVFDTASDKGDPLEIIQQCSCADKTPTQTAQCTVPYSSTHEAYCDGLTNKPTNGN